MQFRGIVVGLLEAGKKHRRQLIEDSLLEAVFFGANLYNHYVERVASDRMCSESNFNFFPAHPAQRLISFLSVDEILSGCL